MADWTRWHEATVLVMHCPRTGDCTAIEGVIAHTEREARELARIHDEWHVANDPLPPDEYVVQRYPHDSRTFIITDGPYAGRDLSIVDKTYGITMIDEETGDAI